jgi:D-alanyl-lipoteichoic acid acyltransferase DltB (MBOAT superfamily)
MQLTSFVFYCFIALLVIVYFLPTFVVDVFKIKLKTGKWLANYQAGILFIFSAVFYGWAAPHWACVFIVSTTVITYFCAIIMQKNISSSYDPDKKKKIRIAFIVALTADLGILLVLKYGNFFARPFLNGSQLGFILPLGLSFYTFHTLSYLIDVQREVVKAEKNPFRLMLFVGFWPSITVGPLNRYNNLAPQFKNIHWFNYKNATFGAQRLLMGLFKKMVIADRVALAVNTAWSDPEGWQGFWCLLAVFLFVLQLYCDFSGCCDICIGASQILGIKLPENFNHPFKARSVQEYWQRWHITLGLWLKDYIFYPTLKSSWLQNLNKYLKVKKNKKAAKKITNYLGLFILWFSVGFWHGANWTFIIGTGLLYWIYILIGREFGTAANKFVNKKLHINTESKPYVMWQQLRTFLQVCVGLLLFRSADLGQAWDIFLNIFKSTNNIPNSFIGIILMQILGMDFRDIVVLFIALGIFFFIQKMKQPAQTIANISLPIRWFLYIGLILIVVLTGVYGTGANANEFIYQQF